MSTVMWPTLSLLISVQMSTTKYSTSVGKLKTKPYLFSSLIHNKSTPPHVLTSIQKYFLVLWVKEVDAAAGSMFWPFTHSPENLVLIVPEPSESSKPLNETFNTPGTTRQELKLDLVSSNRNANLILKRLLVPCCGNTQYDSFVVKLFLFGMASSSLVLCVCVCAVCVCLLSADWMHLLQAWGSDSAWLCLYVAQCLSSLHQPDTRRTQCLYLAGDVGDYIASLILFFGFKLKYMVHVKTKEKLHKLFKIHFSA